jgi:hypothetical protein
MVYNTLDYSVCGLRPVSCILKNTNFWKLIYLHPQVGGGGGGYNKFLETW